MEFNGTPLKESRLKSMTVPALKVIPTRLPMKKSLNAVHPPKVFQQTPRPFTFFHHEISIDLVTFV